MCWRNSVHKMEFMLLICNKQTNKKKKINFISDWIIVAQQCSSWDHLFHGYIMAFTASSNQSSSTSVLLYVLEYLPSLFLCGIDSVSLGIDLFVQVRLQKPWYFQFFYLEYGKCYPAFCLSPPLSLLLPLSQWSLSSVHTLFLAYGCSVRNVLCSRACYRI